tara:strand:- start:63 stop:392 length:330 start_codon:yes stop_codon:yes gene_type:complete
MIKALSLSSFTHTLSAHPIMTLHPSVAKPKNAMKATAKANKLLSDLANGMSTVGAMYDAYVKHVNSTGASCSSEHEDVAHSVIAIMSEVDEQLLAIVVRAARTRHKNKK